MLFVFLLFMSVSSLALAYISYMGIIKLFGVNKNNKASMYFQILIVLLIVIGFNMVVVVSNYAYWVASIPIIIMAAIVINFHLNNKTESKPTTPHEVYKASGMDRQFKNKIRKTKHK